MKPTVLVIGGHGMGKAALGIAIAKAMDNDSGVMTIVSSEGNMTLGEYLKKHPELDLTEEEAELMIAGARSRNRGPAAALAMALDSLNSSIKELKYNKKIKPQPKHPFSKFTNDPRKKF